MTQKNRLRGIQAMIHQELVEYFPNFLRYKFQMCRCAVDDVASGLGTLFGGDYMKRNWELDVLIEHFTILPNEMSLIENKTGKTKISFAVLLKFFQNEARFPSHKFEVPKAVIA